MMEMIKREPYVASRLENGVWAIGQGFVRCFLVEGMERAMLVDTCDADADLAGLVRELTPLPIVVAQTHCDHDHIGASSRFETVYMHPSEFSLLRSTSDKKLAPLAIREGEHIELGGRTIEVILIPGHTPGSIALLDLDERILFSGDTVKNDIVYMFGPGRDLLAYIDSLLRLYAMRERYDVILPCHGGMPLSAGVIPNLIEGARRLSEGHLEGMDDGSGLNCKLYSYKTAHFYY